MNIITHNINDIVRKRINIKFDTDYRSSIMFELLMQNNKISPEMKLQQALKIYYPNISEIKKVDKAVDNIIWFYRCGKENKSTHLNKINRNKQIYSYEFDAEYIYSAFLKEYNIDLTEIEYLHWWKFRALFEGLSKATKIVEIMGYRATDLGTIKHKKEKKFYREMKELYRLPDMRTQQQKESDFASAFI